MGRGQGQGSNKQFYRTRYQAQYVKMEREIHL